MSNLIKSNFIAFSQDEALIIDANKNKIIQAIDANNESGDSLMEETVEEALAEALIRDAELDGAYFDDDVLTVSADELPGEDISDTDLSQMANEVRNSAKQEAEAIVNRAHDEAEQLRADAYDEAEKIRTDAHEEGYHQGYQEAMEAANTEISKEKELIEQQRTAMENELAECKEQLIKETEEKMVDILCDMVTNITGVVVEQEKNVILYMVNHAMQDLEDSRHFVIKVSPEDYAILLEKKSDIYGFSNPNVEIELYEDVKLSSYQCQIETDNGIVDLSLDVQLDNLLTAIRLMIKD